MGKCKYCGKSAGFFSSVHKACEQLHDKGLKELGQLAITLLEQSEIDCDTFLNRITVFAKDHFLSDSEVCNIISGSLTDVNRNYVELSDLMTSIYSLPAKWVRSNAVEVIVCKYLADIISESSNSYFNQEISLDELKNKIIPLQEHYKISEISLHDYFVDELNESIICASDSCIDNLQLYFDYATEFGIEETEIIQKLKPNFKVKLKKISKDYFNETTEIDEVLAFYELIKKHFAYKYKDFDDVLLECLNTAAYLYLEDGVISDAESSRFLKFESSFNLNNGNSLTQSNYSNILKVHQLISLKDIAEGKETHIKLDAPVILGRGEFIAWVFLNSEAYEERTKSEWVGRSSGVNIRLCKGVYYRVGQSKGHKVEKSYMSLSGSGALIVTNKNLIFYSSSKSMKVPYKKIIGVVPYSDGIEIQRETNSRRLVFSGFDPWFIMNLFSVIEV